MSENEKALRDALAAALGDTYTCGRVWEAWQYGTMTQDDFSPAWEDEDLLASLVDAVIALASPLGRAEVRAEGYCEGFIAGGIDALTSPLRRLP